MGRPKRKYESGAATAYITRNKAVRKLQLSIADFRRLCILKGIYPQEPKHKKVVGKGSTAPKTYYYSKDIKFLAQEPIISKFRDFKHFVKKLRKAVVKGNDSAAQRLRANKPKYSLDHIIRERYPTFTDALRDLDDCLSMCFLFSTFPKTSVTHIEFIHLCRRLTVEFLHYVIASRSLRKVFISIKGIYLQAEVQGEKTTWIVPHRVGYSHPTDVDYKIMQTFVEFYTTLLGFVNYKLFHTINLHYPPKLELDTEEEHVPHNKMTKKPDRFAEREAMEERLAAMTQSLKTIDAGGGEDEVELDEFPISESDDPDRIEQAKLEAEKLKKFQNLFTGLKFFLNREVPREIIVFIIRSFGGEVSWDFTVAVGATYPESDEKITHQIVDRPNIQKQFLSRYYVQPQWLFDCVSARLLLPVEDYFPGATLPPHLSPFVEEGEGDYIPPEKRQLLNRQRGIDSGVGEEESESEEEELEGEVKGDSGSEEEEEEQESEEEKEEEDSSDSEEENVTPPKATKRKREKADSEKKKRKSEDEALNISNMSVEAGKIEVEDKERKLQRQLAEEKRLAEMMIPKKKKRLYHKIMYAKKKKTQEARKLKEKRDAIDKAAKKERKKARYFQE
ncbi:hypothetical protein ACJMK2_013087 [Sinanodonta woodiana]|uniref:Pescadillo homolog n=1 Tax=Sinanodonta woodiana TaxID=1069815 RepID=A0ABD3VA82_SINWO